MGLLAAPAAALAVAACGSSAKAGSKTSAGATRAPSKRRVLAPASASARTELAAAAGYLGIGAAQLRSKLRTGESLGELAKSTPGKSEAGLIAAIEQRDRNASRSLQRQVRAQVRTPGGPPRRRLLPLREDAREYLGLTVPQLREREQGGSTLAQIAQAIPARSEAGLIEAIFNDRKRQLEAAVREGRLRADVEHLSLAHLRERVHAYVTQRPAATQGSKTSP